ncbi:hypothetical protein Tco_0183281 [Tanacetum coccineum]
METLRVVMITAEYFTLIAAVQVSEGVRQGTKTTCVLDDEADLTTYDGIGSEERILLLKGFVISKIRHLFLKLRANQANSSQSNEGTGKTSSGSKNTKQGSFEEQL